MADSSGASGKGPITAHLKQFEFTKGKSGNPGGKNDERERLRKYILSEFGEASINGIAELARDAHSEKVRLDAYVWLAEQTVGRAVQAVSAPNGEPLLDIPALVLALRKAAGEDDAEPR